MTANALSAHEELLSLLTVAKVAPFDIKQQMHFDRPSLTGLRMWALLDGWALRTPKDQQKKAWDLARSSGALAEFWAVAPMHRGVLIDDKATSVVPILWMITQGMDARASGLEARESWRAVGRLSTLLAAAPPIARMQPVVQDVQMGVFEVLVAHMETHGAHASRAHWNEAIFAVNGMLEDVPSTHPKLAGLFARWAQAGLAAQHLDRKSESVLMRMEPGDCDKSVIALWRSTTERAGLRDEQDQLSDMVREIAQIMAGGDNDNGKRMLSETLLNKARRVMCKTAAHAEQLADLLPTTVKASPFVPADLWMKSYAAWPEHVRDKLRPSATALAGNFLLDMSEPVPIARRMDVLNTWLDSHPLDKRPVAARKVISALMVNALTPVGNNPLGVLTQASAVLRALGKNEPWRTQLPLASLGRLEINFGLSVASKVAWRTPSKTIDGWADLLRGAHPSVRGAWGTLMHVLNVRPDLAAMAQGCPIPRLAAPKRDTTILGQQISTMQDAARPGVAAMRARWDALADAAAITEALGKNTPQRTARARRM